MRAIFPYRARLTNVDSGKLPYTIGKSVNDYSAKVIYSGSGIVQIPYNEGLFIDYRHFDEVSIDLKTFKS